jgi:hypothetical protein
MKISTVKFTTATNFTVGTEPFFLEVADFNNDGKVDLVTVNHTSNNVSVLFGNGTGSFGTATNFAVGTKPFSLTTGDFNKDGTPDIATTNYQDNNISVLLGNGTGGFGAATNFAVGVKPLSSIVQDLNGDDILDLVAVNDGTDLSVLLGNGTGGFGAAIDVDLENFPIAVKVGDFNDDDIPDLITINTHSTKNLSILLGNGDGSFGAATNVAVGNFPGDVVIEDFNNDGIFDLATANYKTGNLSVLLGRGDGSFGAATNFVTGAKPLSIIAADFDGDGISDLVTTNMTDGNVSVLLGNGDGTFGAATNFAVGEFPGDVTVGDFNRDGRTDLAVTNRGTSNVSILLNQTNRAPVVANPLTAQSIITGTALNFALAANTFTDADAGDVLTYSAKLANNTALPTWLTFNPTTRTFAGTPTAANIGNLQITVTATDKAGLTATNSFALNVNAPANQAPIVANPLTAQSIITGTALNFVLAANTFTDADAGDVLTYSAKLANNTALPTWLTFNPTTRTFAGTPGTTDIGNLQITVTATDKAGLTATNSFGLNIAGNNLPIISGLIPGISIDKNLFKTSESTKGFGIQVVSQKPTNKVNEIGIFAVDDITGKIGSLIPGTTEYLKAALNLAKPILTTLAGDFINLDKQEFEIDPNKVYCFFEIQDGSIAELKQQIVSGQIPTNILFSFPDSSGNSPIKVTNNTISNGYKVSINNDELVLNVVKLDGANVNRPIGSQSQTTPEGRTIDLTNYTGALKADIITKSSAAYTNHIGFYTVEDSIGSIKLSDGTILKPGDANYAVEAIKNALTNSLQAGKIDTKTDITITGGKIYAPVVVAQGTLTDFITKNPTNGGGVNAIHAYFNYVGANSDKIDHFRLIGNNTFGVEDTYGGGDRDFNDLVVKMNVKNA